VNPKGHTSSYSGNPSESMRKVNAAISLRSGREIDNQVRSPNEPCRYPHQFFEKSSSFFSPTGSSSESGDATDGVPNDSDTFHHSPESSSKKDELEKKDTSKSVDPSPSKGHSSSPSSSEKVHMPFPPFPHRLKKKDQAHVEKMRDTFSQVKINIPLLDAIRQMPPYARFLKDLCTTKKATNVPKKAFLASSASSILSHQIPVKYKDPSCPTIFIVIGDQLIHRALLDLGASVNLIPFIEYERLMSGELKPTKMVIQLADRSTRLPRGIIEDVLIQVGEFIYPVDFVVIETETVSNFASQIPVILGRPFLATTNALINCRNGMMTLSFGNMTVELNIFNLQR